MKIRNGFVSNSSSSSFTCDICGEDVSGWDLCLSQSGMKQCSNGHTFCDEHEIETTTSSDQMRQSLIAAREKWRNATWKKPGEVDAEIAEVKAMESGDLEDAYHDYVMDSGQSPESCPVCQMQNVDDSDVVQYAIIKLGFADRKALAAAWRAEFGTYDKLRAWIGQNQKTETKA